MSESLNNIETKIQEDISPTKRLSGFHLKIVGYIAIIWSLFQLWYASPFPFMLDFGMFKGLPARAIHLGFALLLAFLNDRTSCFFKNNIWPDLNQFFVA